MNIWCLYGGELGLYTPLEKDARELSLQLGVKNPDVDNSVLKSIFKGGVFYDERGVQEVL